MLGHLGINVPDLAAAKRYCDALMALVGFEPFFHADDGFAYQPAEHKPGTYLFLYPATQPGDYSPQRTGLQHLAFTVRGRSMVHTVHDHVMRNGDTVIHPPQHFPQYPGHYLRPRSGTTHSVSSSRPCSTTTATE
jgi:catechol 2,3-dioxygenase-like lactoylglutathione lyase family enzyme